MQTHVRRACSCLDKGGKTVSRSLHQNITCKLCWQLWLILLLGSMQVQLHLLAVKCSRSHQAEDPYHWNVKPSLNFARFFAESLIYRKWIGIFSYMVIQDHNTTTSLLFCIIKIVLFLIPDFCFLHHLVLP